jgi:hypothetical protein
MLIAAYLVLVCLQSCVRVCMLMHRERERERERERDGAAIGGRERACRRRFLDAEV